MVSRLSRALAKGFTKGRIGLDIPVAVVRRVRNLVSTTIAISHRSAYTVLKFLFVAGQGRYLKINHGINRARPAPDPEPEGSPLRPKVRYPCLRPPPKLTGHCHLLNDGRIDKAGYRFADLRLEANKSLGASVHFQICLLKLS